MYITIKEGNLRADSFGILANYQCEVDINAEERPVGAEFDL